jgi:hypothetical protein
MNKKGLTSILDLGVLHIFVCWECQHQHLATGRRIYNLFVWKSFDKKTSFNTQIGWFLAQNIKYRIDMEHNLQDHCCISQYQAL